MSEPAILAEVMKLNSTNSTNRIDTFCLRLGKDLLFSIAAVDNNGNVALKFNFCCNKLNFY
ncbi:hypothetical protein GPUN_2604 [Glaciecola punicea ACAM 611]|uniref:Uncharacterized protein n=1 Tax=Glaciecola punicea ACAM 611 TaxID=1121923 RepID=H5TEJ2_9ALTE|nr:hypothetical protein GPUN_2604 [Glaciecola punicea ACAM 611]